MPRIFLAAECVLIFVGVPLLLFFVGGVSGGLFLLLWLMAFFCLYVLSRDSSFPQGELTERAPFTRRNLGPMLLLFLVLAAGIAVFTALFHGDKLFSFPREHALMWGIVMLLYPFLSALPQEIIYRTFFFRRYRTLFPNEHVLIAVNSLLFGFCHIIFHNWISVLMTVAGGYLFARTYARHRSLPLVTLEHALYGCFVFTIGLGQFFYHAYAR